MKLFKSKKVILLSLVLCFFASFSFVFASWTAPTTSAPGNNAFTPINTGIKPQLKSGGLGVNGPLNAYNGLDVTGTANATTDFCIPSTGKCLSTVSGGGGGPVTGVIKEDSSLQTKQGPLNINNYLVVGGTNPPQVMPAINQGFGAITPKLLVNGSIMMSPQNGEGSILFSDVRLHVASNEKIYILAKDGVHITNNWGSTGDLTVDGHIMIPNGTIHGVSSSGTHFDGLGSVNIMSQKGLFVSNNWGGTGDLYVQGKTTLAGMLAGNLTFDKAATIESQSGLINIFPQTDLVLLPKGKTYISKGWAGGSGDLEVAGRINSAGDVCTWVTGTAKCLSSAGGGASSVDWNSITNKPSVIDASGSNQYKSGGLYVAGTFTTGGVINSPATMHLNPAGNLYLLPSAAVIIGREWGGTGQLYVQGGTWSTAYNAYSDIKLKKNIVEIENPLDKISQIRGVTYNWKDEKESQSQQVGVIAQEVEKVLPQVVSTDKKGIKSVDYSKLTPLLIEGMKEQQKQIEKQQKQIDELIKIVNQK